MSRTASFACRKSYNYPCLPQEAPTASDLRQPGIHLALLDGVALSRHVADLGAVAPALRQCECACSSRRLSQASA